MTKNYLRIWWLALALALFMGLVRCADGDKAAKDKLEAAARRDSANVPQITWRDISFNDTVHVGDTIIRDYVFYNTGWKPLLVKHAIINRPECSCRVPGHEVGIGEQDTVRVTCLFTDPERVGMEIVIEHNTPQQSPILVYIANVVK
jgi:hypothetical protein